jgi:putative transposase
MRGKRFSEEQIINILKEADAGLPSAELCRKYGISGATYYNWKARYGDMTVSDARRLKDLERENSRLKKLVADQALDIQMLKEVCSKNF